MRTRSVCGFFLTWVGSYENHCFGINAHTSIFQVGHPMNVRDIKVYEILNSMDTNLQSYIRIYLSPLGLFDEL